MGKYWPGSSDCLPLILRHGKLVKETMGMNEDQANHFLFIHSVSFP